MPAAANKSDLLTVTRKEYDKLTKLISPIEDDLASALHDGVSIKDTIGHRSHWIELFLGWYRDGQAGKTVHFPAEGYKWSDLKAYNADLRKRQSSMSWDDARQLLERNASKLEGFIESLDEDALYGGPMKGANNKWTTGRWAEAAGASHYRSAAKFIRACLRGAV